MPVKIVSGGQTGVDRAALDVAIYLDIEHGGWCPRGRRAEDGRIPPTYQLSESSSRDYSVRTEQNVIDSDGTLILYSCSMSGGTDLTRRLARKHHRPLRTIDLLLPDSTDLRTEFQQWLTENQIQVLNVAGPRASSSPGISRQAEQFLIQLLNTPV